MLKEPFPAVTICNLNPVSQENGHYITQVTELVSAFFCWNKIYDNNIIFQMAAHRYLLSLNAPDQPQTALDIEEKDEESDKARLKR